MSVHAKTVVGLIKDSEQFHLFFIESLKDYIKGKQRPKMKDKAATNFGFMAGYSKHQIRAFINTLFQLSII